MCRPSCGCRKPSAVSCAQYVPTMDSTCKESVTDIPYSIRTFQHVLWSSMAPCTRETGPGVSAVEHYKHGTAAWYSGMGKDCNAHTGRTFDLRRTARWPRLTWSDIPHNVESEKGRDHSNVRCTSNADGSGCPTFCRRCQDHPPQGQRTLSKAQC